MTPASQAAAETVGFRRGDLRRNSTEGVDLW